MRFREITREAVRNLASGTSRAAVLALLVAVTSGTLAALDATAMTDTIDDAAEFRERGGSITILTAENSIDGRVCDSIAGHDGVRAAGALSPSETPLKIAGIPQNPLTFFTASPGFATMLPDATGLQHAGLLLPVDVAGTLGLTLGDPIHTASGPTALGGTYAYPDDGRARGLGYAAIATDTPEQRFSECWVDAYPVTKQTIDALYTAIAADATLPDAGPTLTQHNTTLGTATDPSAAFVARVTGWGPGVAFILAALIGFTAIRARRLEIASALHTGVRKADQTGIVVLETLAWSLAGALTTVPVIALLTRHLAVTDHLPVVLTASLTPVLTASGALLGALAAVLVVREQRLFAYFKSR